MRLMKSVPNFNARWKIHRERIILNLGDLQRKIDELDEKSMVKMETLGRTGTIH